jgi:hypothetical protein
MDPPQSKKMRPSAQWVVLVSFSPLHTTTAKLPHQAKVACLSRRTPRHRPFGLLRSLLRAVNGAKMRASALLTRLDVPFNLMADGVPWNIHTQHTCVSYLFCRPRAGFQLHSYFRFKSESKLESRSISMIFYKDNREFRVSQIRF